MSDAAAPPVAGDVPKENVAAVDEQAAPQVNPEDLPKVSLDILLSVHEAQSVHGLRRNVPDYQRYRKFCTGRLERLRSSLKFHYGKKKFTYRDLTPGAVKSGRYLMIPLYNAERCWAYHLDLAREQEQKKDTNVRIRFHALKRLKKAAKWALNLAQLADVRADERTKLEATAYCSWMRALLAREQLQWKEAADLFFAAQTIFSQLAKAGNSSATYRTVAQGRADNIEPLVAYCAYRMGGSAGGIGAGAMDANLQAKLQSYMQASAVAQAKQARVTWEGRDVEVADAGVAARLSDARFAVLESASAEKQALESVASLCQCCGAMDREMQALEELAVTTQAKHAESNWGKVVVAWAKQELHAARVRRNDVLVRMAAVRVALDNNGPWPANEPALTDQQKREEFVQQSKEYVGSRSITAVDVARILDSMAQQAMPLEDAKEEARRQSAALVLRYRGLRALFLARHEAHRKEWNAALALGRHAVGVLEESASLIPSGTSPLADRVSSLAKQESQQARQEVRLMRIGSAAAAQAASNAASASEKIEPPQLELSADAVAARLMPGKPVLFDLAGSELKFPNLDSRVKKKGFFSSFW